MKQCIDLHTHSHDRFDSQNDPEALCKREKELGAEGFALTQHGTLECVEPMRKAAAAAGLKFVPGCETYYGNEEGMLKNMHLILLAKSHDGYLEIGKAVTDGQNEAGYSVMTDEILRRYFGPGSKGHGRVFATSACIQGPLAAILRTNEAVEKELEKLSRRYAGTEDVSPKLSALIAKLQSLEKEIEKKKQERDAAKKLSESKFVASEKRLAKLLEKSDPAYKSERERIEKDKKAAAAAKPVFDALKKEVAALLKEQTITRKEETELVKMQERHAEYQRRAIELEGRRKTEEELEDAVRKRLLDFVELFGEDNFFVELQYHGIGTEAAVYPVLARIAKEAGVPVVASNDVHLIEKTDDERLRRQILRSLRFGEKFEEEGEGDAELYIKTDEELKEWLLKILPEETVDEAMANTKVIFDQCDVVFPEGEKHYPKFPVPKGETTESVFDAQIRRGIKWRFPNGLDNNHKRQLLHEIKVIKSMGYVDYHLIVKDFLEYARILSGFPEDALKDAPLTIESAKEWRDINGWKGGVSVGPGRGSAVGSLVCYVLGITSMDPMKYGLLFERFLNPERVSMPDIDVDLSKAVRQKTIQYVQHKYGENAVCGILTTNAQAPKGAIRIAAKYYGLKTAGDGNAFLALGDAMAKSVPKDLGISFTSIVNEQTLYESLRASYSKNPHALEILRWARCVEGCFTTYGAHAAGIVISDNSDVKEYIPLRWNKKLNEWTTQCDMVTVEEKGLLKMDFLGLKTLDVITGAERAIQKRTGKILNFDELPLDDAQVFQKIFTEGKTNSVFQFESSGMKSMLRRFKPESFNDLILLVAAYRPGPLQYLDDVIDVKSGKKKVTYASPLMKDILDVTYGYPIYQEQVMALFQKLAGYTLGGADIVRRYMSKKKMDKLVKERKAFVYGDAARGIKGCIGNGISEDDANNIFDQMTEFAKYAFNKSHAAAYALISYWTGWLKCHYPAEFFMSALNWAEDDEEVRGLMREARLFGVPVAAPDVNKSESRFTVSDGRILYGIGSVRSVGATGDAIIEERRNGGAFTSLKDFFIRTQAKKNAVENLIKAGAFDAFCKNRQAMLAVIEVYKALTKKYLEKKKFADDASLILPEIGSCKTAEDLEELQQRYNVAVLEKVVKPENLETRIKNARKAQEDAYEALCSIVLPSDMKEDISVRLKEEHEMLGAYVTGHPLDSYEDVLATPIAEADVTTTELFGIVTDVSRKARKSDGKLMAFITLEDRTGSIEASVFTAAYESCAEYLTAGTVVIAKGKVREEESYMTDEAGEPVTVRKFTVEKMSAPKPTDTIMLTVSSYALFHVDREDAFRKQYEDANGSRLVLYDQSMDQMRKMTYRVRKGACIG